jgi:hypothetical protein
MGTRSGGGAGGSGGRKGKGGGPGSEALRKFRAGSGRGPGAVDKSAVDEFMATSKGMSKAQLKTVSQRIITNIEIGRNPFSKKVGLDTLAAIADRLDRLSR